MTRGYDVAVIGSGPGGHAAALAASRRGLRVALIERDQTGGVCLNVGCIPTKALVAVSQTLRRMRQAHTLGIHLEGVRLDYAGVLARNQRIVTTLREGLVKLLALHKVELVRGQARFEGPKTLRVAGGDRLDTLTAERTIIATGASPSPGPWRVDGQRILSYRDLLALSDLPRTLLIVGGGVIGCEFASCFSSFGTQVTIVEPQPQLLPMEDPEAVRALTRTLKARGVSVLTGTTVETLDADAQGVRARLSSGESVSTTHCLVAIGQTPNSHGLGLELLDIRTAGGIEVNDGLITRHPEIAAIGDCLAGHGLAHLASAEGVLAVKNLCESSCTPLNRELVPRCVYTDPELAHVGPLETRARQSVRVSRFSFAALGKSLCDEEPEGFVKLLVEQSTDRVVGATILGAQASTLIHVVVLAMTHGVSARQLTDTITAHPTLSEGITEAAAQIYGEALSTAGRARSARTLSSRMP